MNYYLLGSIMTNNFHLPVFVLFVSLQIGLDSALHFEISPARYDGLASKIVKFACTPETSDKASKSVLLVELFDEGDNLIASNNGQKVSYGAKNKQRFYQKGGQSTNDSDTSLELFLTRPQKTDSGTYTCVMYYKDGTPLIQSTRVTATLSVSNVELLVKSLRKKLSALKTTVNKKAPSVHQHVAILEERTEMQSRRIHRLVDKETYITAFSATLSRNMPFTKGKTMVFPRIIMQRGEGYNNNTGVFTAPRDGLYLFFLTMGTASPGGKMDISLKVNERVVAKMDVGHLKLNGYRDENSINSVNQLQAGDKVKVMMGDNGTGYFRTEKICMFGCYCITPIVTI